MKSETLPCLARKATTVLTETISQQEKIKNILWERMVFAIDALKKKQIPLSSVIEELESTICKAQDLENIFLKEKS